MSSVALTVKGLRVTYPGPPPVQALDGISLTVSRGQCLGVIGESGSGKSTLARALLGLLPDARVEGEVDLDGLDLHSLDEQGWRKVRWRRLSLAFQSTSALNPVLRVGAQVAEPLRVHLGLDHQSARQRAEELLDEVGLGPWAASRLPGELSGGQQRLVLVAMAAACGPDVILLDEPTAGLDPVTRERLTDFLRRLRSESGTTLVVLSHDAAAVAALADWVVVLYRGWLAETGPTTRVLDEPRHPYTQPLLASIPSLGTVKDLRGIRGDPPSPTEVAEGCPFLGRCTQSIDACHPERPPLLAPPGEDGRRRVACVRAGLVAVLKADGLRKSYRLSSGLGRQHRQAVDGVSVEVREGEVVGLVGATGAGKSTLAKLLVRLIEPDGGTVLIEGRDLLSAEGTELKDMRRRVQLLFQDPFEALSPRLTIAEAVREPLDVQDVGSRADRDERVRRALASVRVPPEQSVLGRRSHELSGGQLQRVALARALVLEPKLLVADEPVSMLDPSEQAKMLQLLKTIQVERGMAMVLISHDLAVVLRVADRVLVLDRGRVVEEASGTRLLLQPSNPTTRALLSAAGWDLGLSSGRSASPLAHNDEDQEPEGSDATWVDAGKA